MSGTDLIDGVAGFAELKIPIWEIIAAAFLNEQGIATKDELFAALSSLATIDPEDLTTFCADYVAIDPPDVAANATTFNALYRRVVKLEALWGLFLVFLCSERRGSNLDTRAKVLTALTRVFDKANAG